MLKLSRLCWVTRSLEDYAEYWWTSRKEIPTYLKSNRPNSTVVTFVWRHLRIIQGYLDVWRKSNDELTVGPESGLQEVLAALAEAGLGQLPVLEWNVGGETCDAVIAGLAVVTSRWPRHASVVASTPKINFTNQFVWALSKKLDRLEYNN